MKNSISTSVKVSFVSFGLAALTSIGLYLAKAPPILFLIAYIWLGLSISGVISGFFQFDIWSQMRSPKKLVGVMLSISLALLIDQTFFSMVTNLTSNEVLFFSIIAIACIAIMALFGKRNFLAADKK